MQRCAVLDAPEMVLEGESNPGAAVFLHDRHVDQVIGVRQDIADALVRQGRAAWRRLEADSLCLAEALSVGA